jgi:endonuclease YncB( thermonuclease family)
VNRRIIDAIIRSGEVETMFKGRSVAFLLFLGVLATFGSRIAVSSAQTVPPGGAPPAGSGTMEVEGFVRAITGDVLDARLPPGRTVIAIVGIRAPQGNTPCGQAATAFVQALVAEGARFEEEPGLAFDARNRRLYNVFTLDGRSVAEEAVSAGVAKANGLGSDSSRLADLESAARDAHRGCLWTGGSQ